MVDLEAQKARYKRVLGPAFDWEKKSAQCYNNKFFPITVTDFRFRNILLSEEQDQRLSEVRFMRRRRRNNGNMPCILAAAAFVTALVCLAVFSAKCILLIVAAALIVLGIFLLRL